MTSEVTNMPNRGIKVDIDELMAKLEEIKNDDYETVLLRIDIDEDEIDNELSLAAVSFEDEEPINYGTIGEVEQL